MAIPASDQVDPRQHVGLVLKCAGGGCRREKAERISDGYLGLVSAARRYDPTLGHAFSTYAIPRIRGAILDGIRARRGWRRLNGGQRVAEAVALGDWIAGPEETDRAAILTSEANRLRFALLTLPTHERQMISLLFYEDRPAVEVAEMTGVSQGRISQIKRSALERLRRRLVKGSTSVRESNSHGQIVAGHDRST